MKNFILLVLCCLAASFSSAQYEHYGAQIVGDTVKIWNTNIYVMCGASFIADTRLANDSIIVVEEDTSTRHAYCDCFYDVNTSITGITSGSYHSVIYRKQSMRYQYPADTTFLVGSIDISLGNTSPGAFKSVVAISDCHNTPVSVERVPLAGTYALLSSYPNPFNPTTTIRYSIPNSDIVSLTVHDNLGRSVAKLASGRKSAGVYNVQFDAGSLSSGVYFCRLIAGRNVISTKLVVVK